MPSRGEQMADAKSRVRESSPLMISAKQSSSSVPTASLEPGIPPAAKWWRSDLPFRALRRLQHVLVPVDFSPESEAAAGYAVALARAHKARVTLLHVLVAAPLPMDPGWYDLVWEEQERRAEAKMVLLAQRLRLLARGVGLATALRPGSPVARTCAEVWNLEADLVVLSAGRHSAMEEWIFGSFVEGMVRHAPCPVLILRGEEQHSSRGKLPARVLVPIDFSPRAEEAVHAAAVLAGSVEGKVSLVHVLDRKAMDEELLTIGAEMSAVTAEASSRLRVTAGRLLPSALAGTLRIHAGDPFAQILAEAEAEQSDLLAMTTHGRTGLAHVLMGSTAERILRHARCPVLMVRQRER